MSGNSYCQHFRGEKYSCQYAAHDILLFIFVVLTADSMGVFYLNSCEMMTHRSALDDAECHGSVTPDLNVTLSRHITA